MWRIISTWVLFIIFALNVNAAELPCKDVIYRSQIKTLQLINPHTPYALPVISLQSSNDVLELSFDDLDGDYKNYTLTFLHCNADWTPSNLKTGEFLDGFFEFNIVTYSFSVGTYQKFTHYKVQFPSALPQQFTRFKLSGNYMLFIFENGDAEQPVLSKRFIVTDAKAAIQCSIRQPVSNTKNGGQQLELTIDLNASSIANPARDVHLTVVQNNRWDNMAQQIQPQFVQANRLTYQFNNDLIFEGGNEYRPLDIRSIRFQSPQIQKMYRDEQHIMHAELFTDESRAVKPYLYYADINGAYTLYNRDAIDPQSVLETDYVICKFSFRAPESSSSFFLSGNITSSGLNSRIPLYYNSKSGHYETEVLLKQGFYNYIYTDAKGSSYNTEGSFWDTENEYTLIVYYRPFGTYFDQVIGLVKCNSLKAR